jgi:hypothetical protein
LNLNVTQPNNTVPVLAVTTTATMGPWFEKVNEGAKFGNVFILFITVGLKHGANHASIN